MTALLTSPAFLDWREDTAYILAAAEQTHGVAELLAAAETAAVRRAGGEELTGGGGDRATAPGASALAGGGGAAAFAGSALSSEATALTIRTAPPLLPDCSACVAFAVTLCRSPCTDSAASLGHTTDTLAVAAAVLTAPKAFLAYACVVRAEERRTPRGHCS
jgi:hypothetical protein